MDTDSEISELDLSFSPITDTELDSIDQPSAPFVGNWHRLVSTTNWEKGEIICRWRDQLSDRGTSPRLFSDPAWSRLVGEISAQHVGRLRRTYQRFGQVYSDYSRLYWSHFYAALDWEDAEMWLEGAVQNGWSVAKMRYKRWHTLGAVQANAPRAGDVVMDPDDEGIALLQSKRRTEDGVIRKDEALQIEGPVFEGPDFGDDDTTQGEKIQKQRTHPSNQRVDIEKLLASLPADVAKAFVDFRQAIERLRNEGWETVKRIDIVALIYDLRQLLRSETKQGNQTDDSPEASDVN